ncbi:MAG: proton-conducting transporter transmembrane domain-containing protein [Candidatus Bipolaricaulaceae bacterium]
MWEKGLKVFLGFSTLSQLGYILIGVGLGAELEAIFYTVVHGLGKGLLFLAAGEGVEAAGRREIAKLANRLSAPAALALAVGTWAMVGLPPLAGFFAKSMLGQSLPGWAKWVLFARG